MWWANHAAIQTLWQASSLDELLARDFGSDMSLATERRLQEYLRRFQQHEQEEAQQEDESTSCTPKTTPKPTTTTVIRDQWTFYPNNGQYQVTAQLSLSPIYIQNDDDPNQEPYMALLNETDLHSLLVQPKQEAPEEAPQQQEAQWTAMQGESPSSTLPTTTAEEDDHNPSTTTTTTTTTTSSVGSTPTTCSPKDETPQQVVAAQGLRGVELLRHLPVAVSQFTVQGQLMDQNPQAQHWFEGITDDRNHHSNSESSSSLLLLLSLSTESPPKGKH